MMEYLIDKRTAREWISHFHSKNEHRVSRLPESKMVDVLNMSADVAQSFFNCLSEHAPDDATRTQVIEAATHGMMFAIMQTLLITTPPAFEMPAKTVN